MVTQVTPLATIMLGMIVKRLIIKITMMVTLQKRESGNPNPILLLLPLLILPLLKPLLLHCHCTTTQAATAPLRQPPRLTLSLPPFRQLPRLTLRLTLRLPPFRQILKLTPPRLSPPKQTLSLLSKLWTKITHKRFLK